jgi:hypothetical protein
MAFIIDRKILKIFARIIGVKLEQVLVSHCRGQCERLNIWF